MDPGPSGGLSNLKMPFGWEREEWEFEGFGSPKKIMKKQNRDRFKLNS